MKPERELKSVQRQVQTISSSRPRIPSPARGNLGCLFLLTTWQGCESQLYRSCEICGGPNRRRSNPLMPISSRAFLVGSLSRHIDNCGNKVCHWSAHRPRIPCFASCAEGSAVGSTIRTDKVLASPVTAGRCPLLTGMRPSGEEVHFYFPQSGTVQDWSCGALLRRLKQANERGGTMRR